MRFEATTDTLVWFGVLFGGLFAMSTVILALVAFEAFSTGSWSDVGPLFVIGFTLFMGINAVVCFAVSSAQFGVGCFEEDGRDEASSNGEEAGGNES